MENKTTSSDLDYFGAILSGFINTYHPQKAGDRQFIESQSAQAEDVYFSRVHEGDSLPIALEAAFEVLLGNLEFSLFEIIHNLICEHFPQIPSGKRKRLSLSILPDAETLMKNYPEIQENDSQMYEFETKLIGTISEYLESHGIQ